MPLDDSIVKKWRENQPNYIVEDEDVHKGTCAIYFSSNDIYNPNNRLAFNEIICKKDRYEWYKTRIKEASRHVFVRDVYKQWYIEGINEACNSPDKLLELLRDITKGYKIITIGSSAGGYVAILIGLKLGAYKIIAFSPQFSLNYLLDNCSEKCNPIIYKYRNTDRNRFYDLSKIINLNNDSIFYIFPKWSVEDNNQISYIRNFKKINTISINSSLHGIPFHVFILEKFINLNNYVLVRLAKHGNWNKIHLGIKVLGPVVFTEKIINYYYVRFKRKLYPIRDNVYGKF